SCCSDGPGVDQKFGAAIVSSHQLCHLGGVAAFHQPKSKSSSRERLRAGGDSGVPSEDDDDDDDPCISRSSPECHGTQCDHGAEGGHDHFHLRVRENQA
ncbi:hypothetical protein pipiens_000969, partial [Culex pipiens pipiens]